MHAPVERGGGLREERRDQEIQMQRGPCHPHCTTPTLRCAIQSCVLERRAGEHVLPSTEA
jgi:hypothetical protein